MLSNKLKSTIKYLLYLLAFTPLIITPLTIFPFIFGRGIAVQVLIEVIFALYIVLAICNKEYRPKKNIITILLGLFLGVLFIFSLLGADFNRSFWGNESRFTGWLYLFHLFLLFIVVLQIFKTKNEWKKFLGINVLVAIFMFAIAILSLFGVKFWGVDLGTRISGSLGNPIFLASYFILNLTFALYLFFNTKHLKIKLLWLLFAFIIFFGIILTQSNGALLGLASGAIMGLIVYGLLNKNKKAKQAVIASMLLGIISVSLLFVFKNTDFVEENIILNRIVSVSISSGTASTRFMSWRVAVDGIMERPMLGWGVEGFKIVFNKYYNPQLLKYSYYETWSNKPHNKILEVAVDAGFLGLGIYLSIFIVSGYFIYRKRKQEELSLEIASLLFAGLTAYFVQNLFIFDTPVSYLLFFIFLAFIASPLKNNQELQEVKIHPIYIPLALSIILPFIWFINISPIYASVKLRQNTTLFDAGQKINIKGYKAAMQYFNPYKEEWRVDLAKAVVMALRRGQDFYNDQEINYALEELKRNTKEHPNDTYYHMLLGGFYTELAVSDAKYYDLAKAELSRALELSPKRQHIYFVYGRLYGLMKNKGELIKTFETAIELAPDASISYWEGITQLNLLDPSDALNRQWLIKAMELGFVPKDKTGFLFVFKQLHEYFLEKKNYEVLSSFYQKMQALEPNEAKWPAKEATVRYFMGDMKEALRKINKAIELDENYREEGEEFIKVIEAGK